MKISVAMITYNHEKFIAQAIESVLMQKTDFKFELVIGEDSSTDGTRAIVRNYGERYPERIKLLFQERNRGAGANALATLQACKGVYVAFLEGDDYWIDPDKLQKQADFLDANPEYVICHHDAILVDEDGTIIEESTLDDDLKRDFSSDELIKGAWVLTPSACFRNVLEEIPPEILKVPAGDKFLFSMLGNYGCSKYMGREIRSSAYRRHSGGVWSGLGRDEQIIISSKTFYWLARYYGRIGKKEYQKYWADMYHGTLLDLLEADNIKYRIIACKEFLFRRGDLLDIRFAYIFVATLAIIFARKAYQKMIGTYRLIHDFIWHG